MYYQSHAFANANSDHIRYLYINSVVIILIIAFHIAHVFANTCIYHSIIIIYTRLVYARSILIVLYFHWCLGYVLGVTTLRIVVQVYSRPIDRSFLSMPLSVRY